MGYGEGAGKGPAVCPAAYFFADGFHEALFMKFGRFVVLIEYVSESNFKPNIKT